MSKEALRLADALSGGYDAEMSRVMDKAATELRRLHAENAELKTTPPAQRPWVGLNDDELADFWFKQSLDWMEFARVIEDALRSKNT